MSQPLSYAALLNQADKHAMAADAARDRRQQEQFAMPGGGGGFVMPGVTTRLPPQWDAFFQAMQNAGATKMRVEQGHDTIDYPGMTPSNQIGIRRDYQAQAPESMAGLSMRQRPLGPTNSTAQSKIKVQGQKGGKYAGTAR